MSTLKNFISSNQRVEDLVNEIELQILPKDPIEVLNELKPGRTFLTKPDNDIVNRINAYVEVDGKMYTAFAKSELVARQKAAETAVKDLFFETIMSVMIGDDDDNIIHYNTRAWKLLASFAMFKLMEEWIPDYMSHICIEDHGKIETHSKSTRNSNPLSIVNNKPLPIVHNKPLPRANNNTYQKEIKPLPTVNNKPYEKKIKPKKITNDDKILFRDTNPIVVLNTLLGNTRFIDLQVNKDKPPFSFSIVIDDTAYFGESAESKKIAKQNVSRKVLIEKYGYQLKA